MAIDAIASGSNIRWKKEFPISAAFNLCGLRLEFAGWHKTNQQSNSRNAKTCSKWQQGTGWRASPTRLGYQDGWNYWRRKLNQFGIIPSSRMKFNNNDRHNQMHGRGLPLKTNVLPIHRSNGKLPINVCWGTNSERQVRLLLARKIWKQLLNLIYRMKSRSLKKH